MFDLEDSYQWLFYKAKQNVENYKPPERPVKVFVPQSEPEPALEKYAPPAPCPRPPSISGAKKKHWSMTFQQRFSSAVSGKKYVSYVENVVGYGMDQCRVHIERQFTSGMTWKNYAGSLPFGSKKRKWHIDHITPKSSFCEGDVKICFALANLRPLWSKDNMKKGKNRTHLL